MNGIIPKEDHLVTRVSKVENYISYYQSSHPQNFQRKKPTPAKKHHKYPDKCKCIMLKADHPLSEIKEAFDSSCYSCHEILYTSDARIKYNKIKGFFIDEKV